MSTSFILAPVFASQEGECGGTWGDSVDVEPKPNCKWIEMGTTTIRHIRYGNSCKIVQWRGNSCKSYSTDFDWLLEEPNGCIDKPG